MSIKVFSLERAKEIVKNREKAEQEILEGMTNILTNHLAEEIHKQMEEKGYCVFTIDKNRPTGYFQYLIETENYGVIYDACYNIKKAYLEAGYRVEDYRFSNNHPSKIVSLSIEPF